MTRRAALRFLAATPLAATGACCATKYPSPAARAVLSEAGPMPPLLRPAPRAPVTAGRAVPIVDVHAHFFNASDVPVRGFVAECLGHNALPIARPLIRALAAIADRVAERAPTAAEELQALRSMVADARGLGATAAATMVQDMTTREQQDAARRVAEVIRGTDFEREYRRMKRTAATGAALRTGAMTADEVLDVVRAAEQPSSGQAPATAAPSSPAADVADGLLGFLNYFLSPRWSNLAAYKHAYTVHEAAFGIDAVLGALVDFDFWLDCPPRSNHEDQIALHHALAQLHGGYFRPVVAYNPWTDINQEGAGLARVVHAHGTLGFAAVKIYPPTGFVPALNVSRPQSPKRHPDLKVLDDTLAAFFGRCAELRIPIIAHAARSNGRDAVHDEFSGPDGWAALLERHASRSGLTLDFGHFGGGTGVNWTDGFGRLMKAHAGAELFADLGYWEELMCPAAPGGACLAARKRLGDVLKLPVTDRETVADRTMFATDWLMLSQVKRWADYPALLRDSLAAIAPGTAVDRILGANAARCFRLTFDR